MQNKILKQNKKKSIKIKKGYRVKVTQSNLYYILKESQKIRLESHGNSRNFYRNIISGSRKQ